MIKVGTVNAKGCGIAVSAPSDADLEIGSLTADRCFQGLHLTEPALLARLGFREDTPVDEIIKLITYVADDSEASPSSLLEKIKERGLLDYLASAADGSAVCERLIQLVHSSADAAKKIIESLSSIG